MKRRTLLGAALASAAFPSARLLTQVFPPAGYGTPVRTTPFTPDVYRERRARLMGQMKGGVAVLYGAPQIAQGAAVEPATQQDADFAWLTGIVDEPGAVLVLAPGERTYREYLLLPSREPESERWEIERLPLGAELERRTGFARVQRVSALDRLIVSLAQRHKELHFLGPVNAASGPVPPALELYGKVAQRLPGVSITDSSALLAALRIVKEPRELELMRKAVAATRAGHLAAMRAVRPGMSERQLKLILENAFILGGGTGIAYESIVAAGRNAASLHYTGGDGVIQPGSLILIDAGASVGGYACDVTRTFPAEGRFTPAQRDIYNIVLAAQDAAAAKLRAGAYYEDVAEASRDVIRRAGHIDNLYHGVGHLVGLDVHDAGDVSRPLPAGAVITIEPGIYIQSENYGIRIEDQYLVTPRGAERMSSGIPRTVEEIETFMANR